MPVKTPNKVECLNPNTGGRMMIDDEVHDVISKAIYHTLKQNKKSINIFNIYVLYIY